MGVIPQAYRFKRHELKHAPKRIRRIHCLCGTVIAEEAGPISGTAIEWRSITKDGLWNPGRWWGNRFKCPNCGAEGALPIDKPVMEMGS